MLIIYRATNGEIITLDHDTPAAAMAAYLAQSEHGSEMAYLDMELDAEPLSELIASVQGYGERGRFRVDVERGQLLDGDTPVAASTAASVLAAEIAAASDFAELRAATSKVLALAKPGSTPQPWVQPSGAHDVYHIGDIVLHNGQVWECVAGDASGANSWAPGVYGWSVV